MANPVASPADSNSSTSALTPPAAVSAASHDSAEAKVSMSSAPPPSSQNVSIMAMYEGSWTSASSLRAILGDVISWTSSPDEPTPEATAPTLAALSG